MDLGKAQRSFLPTTRFLSPDIVMLVSNDGWDVRALKEARSLAAGGFSIACVGRRRYVNDLARFSDEFGIDILRVPQIISRSTLREFLERGVWFRMSFMEKLIASLLDVVLKWTNFRLTPKYVPPPISDEMKERLRRRAKMLAAQSQNAKPQRHKSIRSLWLASLRRTVGGIVRRVERKSGRFAPLTRWMTAGAVLLPLAIIALPFAAIGAVAYLLFRLAALASRGGMAVLRRAGGPGKRLAEAIEFRWKSIGRHAYRYGRFFLYTIEYGETVARLNPKVIHAHDLYTLQAAVRIARWIGAEVVYDAHELESDRRADTPPLMRRWIIRQEKRYAPKATQCITVSHAIADEMRDTLGVSRPEVIFNAPIVQEAPRGWRDRTLRTDLGLDPAIPLFVFVGKIYEIHSGNQKISLILRGVCKNPEFHLGLVGPLSREAEKQIAELVAAEGLADRVHLIAPIPAEAIVHYIKDANVGIYFMWPETRNIDLTIPNKLFEFSLAGLPLVVTDLVSTRWFCEICRNATLVDSQEVEEIARACRETISRSAELRPDTERLAEIQTAFSWEAQGRQLNRIYRSLLIDHAAKRALQSPHRQRLASVPPQARTSQHAELLTRSS